MTVNGNVSFDLTAVNTDSSSIPRTSIGFRLQNGANVNVNSDSVDLTLKGGDLRGFYVENSQLNISANDIYVKSTINEEKASYNQGVYLTQGSLTLNGSSATFVLEGSNVQQKALNLVADQTGSTLLNINTESLNLQVTGSGNESYGIVASATTGIVNISSKSIIANISDNVAYGLYAQYGARVSQTNPEALLDISVRGREEAVGIMNSTYGGSGTFQYGSINITGDTKISVEAEGTAIGIANQIYPGDTIDIISPADGINLQGQNWVAVVSTSAEGQAIGVLADNTQYDPNGLVPTSSTKISNLNVSATGENGAKSFGIYGAENSKLELSGTTNVTAKGEDAIGMTLENAQIAITGEALITGDSNGITINEDSILNINNAGHITTNTISSTGTSNLAENTVLTVTGGTDTSSSLGTVNANSASIELGSGSYDISTLTGDNNSLVLTDLSNTETVAIQTKSGRLAMRATGASNDQYDNAQAAANALSRVVEIETDNTAEGNTLAVEEGAVNNGLTAKVDANGNLSDVAETKNTKLDALGSVSALSAMTLRHEMNSLSKRMGELRDAPAGVGTWARYYGSEMEYGAQNLTSKNNTIQIGSDYTVGDWKVGVAANYTDGESSYDNGSADNKNYGLAVYGTWFVPCGAYVDLIAKYSRMDNDFALNGMNGSYENNAFNVSAETGYRFEFMDGGLFVEPQVGVSYGRIMGDDFTAQNGVRVEQDDYDSLIGRVGVRTGFKFPKDKGLIYARVSGLYDFQGEMNATATSGSARNTIEEDLGGAWLELGVGANFNWTDNTYSYIDVERTNGGDVKENYRFNVGIRHTF